MECAERAMDSDMHCVSTECRARADGDEGDSSCKVKVRERLLGEQSAFAPLSYNPPDHRLVSAWQAYVTSNLPQIERLLHAYMSDDNPVYPLFCPGLAPRGILFSKIMGY